MTTRPYIDGTLPYMKPPWRRALRRPDMDWWECVHWPSRQHWTIPWRPWCTDAYARAMAGKPIWPADPY